jgi:hypothetical protein
MHVAHGNACVIRTGDLRPGSVCGNQHCTTEDQNQFSHSIAPYPARLMDFPPAIPRGIRFFMVRSFVKSVSKTVSYAFFRVKESLASPSCDRKSKLNLRIFPGSG